MQFAQIFLIANLVILLIHLRVCSAKKDITLQRLALVKPALLDVRYAIVEPSAHWLHLDMSYLLGGMVQIVDRLLFVNRLARLVQ